jgi:hypothetical protein
MLPRALLTHRDGSLPGNEDGSGDQETQDPRARRPSGSQDRQRPVHLRLGPQQIVGSARVAHASVAGALTPPCILKKVPESAGAAPGTEATIDEVGGNIDGDLPSSEPCNLNTGALTLAQQMAPSLPSAGTAPGNEAAIDDGVGAGTEATIDEAEGNIDGDIPSSEPCNLNTGASTLAQQMAPSLPSVETAPGNEAAIDDGVGEFNGPLDPPRLFSPQPLLSGLLGTAAQGSPHLFCTEEHLSLPQFLDGPPELAQLAHVSPQHTPGSPETMPLVPVSPHLEVGWLERTPPMHVLPQPTSEPPETGICDVPPPDSHNLKVYSRRKAMIDA